VLDHVAAQRVEGKAETAAETQGHEEGPRSRVSRSLGNFSLLLHILHQFLHTWECDCPRLPK
jgi:hypothetical protein